MSRSSQRFTSAGVGSGSSPLTPAKALTNTRGTSRRAYAHAHAHTCTYMPHTAAYATPAYAARCLCRICRICRICRTLMPHAAYAVREGAPTHTLHTSPPAQPHRACGRLVGFGESGDAVLAYLLSTLAEAKSPPLFEAESPAAIPLSIPRSLILVGSTHADSAGGICDATSLLLAGFRLLSLHRVDDTDVSLRLPSLPLLAQMTHLRRPPPKLPKLHTLHPTYPHSSGTHSIPPISIPPAASHPSQFHQVPTLSYPP